MNRSFVIIGMPGSGKSTVGRRLAARLGLPFADSDAEIETAAGMTIAQIFERFGEPDFRTGERKVIARLLSGPPLVLSTGGGAFMNEQTRDVIKNKAVSIWLKGDFDLLMKRCARSEARPLLKKGDPATILRDLMTLREPIFATADITIQTNDSPVEATVDRVLEALDHYADRTKESQTP